MSSTIWFSTDSPLHARGAFEVTVSAVTLTGIMTCVPTSAYYDHNG